jgi:hypothetical protein
MVPEHMALENLLDSVEFTPFCCPAAMPVVAEKLESVVDGWNK